MVKNFQIGGFMNRNPFGVILFLNLLSLSAPGAISNFRFSFIQVGLIHNYHFDPNFNYPPSALISIVENVKPDLICGEAVESQWNSGLAGLFPFENRILDNVRKRASPQGNIQKWTSC